jgi:hypothetical protein
VTSLRKLTPADLLETLRAWRLIPRAPEPPHQCTRVKPWICCTPPEPPDIEIETEPFEFDVNAIGERWWP